MTTTETRSPIRGVLSPTERWLLALVVAVELIAVASYFLLTPAAIRSVRYVLYPFVWIDLGLLAVLKTDVAPATSLHRRVAAVAAGAYFLLLMVVAGLVGVTVDLPLLRLSGGLAVGGVAFVPLADLLAAVPLHSQTHATGVQVTMAAPGWGPRVAFVTHAFYVNIVPYRVAGYLALAYLAYGAALDTARATVPGVVGLASCIGCSFPLVASAVAGVVGSAALVGAVVPLSVDLSTAAYVLAVGLLYWRPGA